MRLQVVSNLVLANYITDTIVLIDMETSASNKNDERQRFIGVVRDAEKYLPEGTLKERLDIDTLGELGIVKYPKKFFTAVIKLKTKLL